ncbi:MAG: hypothetical protein JWL63_2400, partial [Rhodocyclales bacterium]|nr:hypothetical protein [Rhodocyclales bacterium]
MTFVIRRIEQGDLDRIYPDSEADQISKFTYAKRTFPAVERGMNWAVNDKSNAF